MKQSIQYSAEVPVVRTPDVAVMGAGQAGFAAALAAARAGARTMLVDRWGMVGGTGVMGFVQGTSSMRTQGTNRNFPGAGHELFETIAKLTPDCFFDSGGEALASQPEAIAHAMIHLLRGAGVELWLHTGFVDLHVHGGRISDLILHNKSGLLAVQSRMVVDCTGDGDVAAKAGVPMRSGRAGDGAKQPASIMFSMAGVDAARAEPLINQPIRMDQLGIDREELRSLIPDDLEGFEEDGDLLPLPQGRLLFFPLPQGQVCVNMTRLIGIDGTRGADVSRAEIDGRRQMMVLVEILRRWVPGFESARLVRAAAAVGIRETRTIVGHYTMGRDDVLTERRFDDAVAYGSYPIDIHSPDGKGVDWRPPQRAYYEIPYRSLLPQGVGNLLVAGRCVSADHEALASVRIQGTAMATGQAAGAAAALAAAGGVDATGVSATAIREQLARAFDFAGWTWAGAARVGDLGEQRENR